MYSERNTLATLTNCTLSRNVAGVSGGGIANYWGSITSLSQVIVSGNAASSGPDVHGAFSSAGFNLIGNSADSFGWIGSDLVNEDPLLGVTDQLWRPDANHAAAARQPGHRRRQQ